MSPQLSMTNLEDLFLFCFVSISFLIPGYIKANFLLGKIFHDIPLKYSIIGIKYLL